MMEGWQRVVGVTGGDDDTASRTPEEEADYHARNRRGSGAFYTAELSAAFLAIEALDAYADEHDPVWRDQEFWRTHTILDPSCGSGALLAGILECMLQRAAAQGADEYEISALRTVIVEHSIIGIDIDEEALLYCYQRLAKHGDKPQNLYLAPYGYGWDGKESLLGPTPDNVRCGALELLDSDSLEQSELF